MPHTPCFRADLPAAKPYPVQGERLLLDLETLRQIGRGDNGGIYRPAFSQADLQARAWLQSRAKEAGLACEEDAAGNIIITLQAPSADTNAAATVTGSHLDSVPGGGHLDGALGVIAGLECLRTLKESQAPLKRPVQTVCFADEEGCFGAMYGSRAFCGTLGQKHLDTATNLDGHRLVDALEAAGVDPGRALSALRSPQSIDSFLELHIEQGPILENEGLAVGVVDHIVGLRKWQCAFGGRAGHAGTTPMVGRQDAFMGLATFASALDSVLKTSGSKHSVCTIGRVDVRPGAANVIPNHAAFSLETRDPSAEVLERLAVALEEKAQMLATARHLSFTMTPTSAIAPVPSDPALVRLLQQCASLHGQSPKTMLSGAAHDAQTLATITPTAMLFVPSVGGRSHCPQEATQAEHLILGTQILCSALGTLASR